MLRIRSQ
jgi:hypothetical protein